jgi:tetratricopeptide (TPR) repeat protein
VPVNKENALKYGIVQPEDSAKIVKELILDVGENGIYKGNLAMLEQLANNDWKRPIYFTGGSFKDEDYLWAKNYLQLDGLTYKLVPIYTPYKGIDFGHINTKVMYNNVKKWDWGNMNKDIYLDPETRRNSLTYRNVLFRLADSLYVEGKKQKAEEILDMSVHKMPVDKFGFYSSLLDYIDLYYKLGKQDKARQLAGKLLKKFKEYLDYYADLPLQDKYQNFDDIERNFLLYREVLKIATQNNDNQFAEDKMKDFEGLMNKYQDMLKE